MSWDLNELHPDFQDAATQIFLAASRAGLLPKYTSMRRTAMQQLRLWKNYLEGQSALPALPPGLSAHEYGIAFDMLVYPYSALADVGAVWQDWGGVWGGAVDPVHFEIPNARSYILSHLAWDSLATGIDFLISFLPYVGQATTVSSLLQFFPRWADNSVLAAVGQPAETLEAALQGSK